MSTTVAEEAPTAMVKDDSALAELREHAQAELRETRFKQRQADLNSDRALDPRLRALYLDRTLWDTSQIAEFLGISNHRVTLLRTSVRKPTRSKPPHPSVLPDADANGTIVDGVLRPVRGTGRPLVEAGRIREWAVDSERAEWRVIHGMLVKALTPPRHGPGEYGIKTASSATGRSRRKKDTDDK